MPNAKTISKTFTVTYPAELGEAWLDARQLATLLRTTATVLPPGVMLEVVEPWDVRPLEFTSEQREAIESIRGQWNVDAVIRDCGLENGSAVGKDSVDPFPAVLVGPPLDDIPAVAGRWQWTYGTDGGKPTRKAHLVMIDDPMPKDTPERREKCRRWLEQDPRLNGLADHVNAGPREPLPPTPLVLPFIADPLECPVCEIEHTRCMQMSYGVKPGEPTTNFCTPDRGGPHRWRQDSAGRVYRCDGGGGWFDITDLILRHRGVQSTKP